MSQLVLRVQGEAFSNSKYDLRLVEQVLTNYRQIIDPSVALLLGHKTLAARIKSQIHYQVSFKEGSWDVLTEFVIENWEFFAVLVSQRDALQLAMKVAQMISGIFSLRRKWTNVLENNLEPKISSGGDVNLNDVKMEGNCTININPVILPAAEATKGPVDRLVKSVDGTELALIEFQAEEIVTQVTSEDLRITGTQRVELPSLLDITGRLDVIAFTAHKGQLITGIGRYPVIWDEDLRPRIRQFADREGITFRVRPIIDRRRFREEPIGFHILRCWEQQLSL